FATDEGVICIFGVNQVRNEDKPLFSLLPKEVRLSDSSAVLGRAQVVHAIENDFWVLANGELQRFSFQLFSQELRPQWPASARLGSPVHAAQLDEAGKTIFVVTQDLTRQIYLASAVDAETGKILWQRQLGLESQGDPLVLGKDVLLMDRGGGVVS